MTFGLNDAIVSDLCAVLHGTQGIRRALIFGSRSRGQFGNASDIDLAIDAPGLSDAEFARLCEALEAVPMIFRLDIVRLDGLKNALLLMRIERDGVSMLGP